MIFHRRFLYSNLQNVVLESSLLPFTLKSIRAIIFPGNTMGPPAPPLPTPEETLQIRRNAAEHILSLVSMPVLRTFFATDSKEEMLKEVEEDILDCIADENMNKHLIYGILELIVVRLVSEMADKTPSELLAERGVVLESEEREKEEAL
jgi:hypothetical protein